MATLNVILRHATPDDLLGIMEIARRDTDALGFLPRMAYCDYLARRWILVACLPDNPVPIGYVVWRVSHRKRSGERHGETGREAKIMQIAVLRGWRGRGVATALLGRVIRSAARQKCQRVSCWVRVNLSANRFWERQQFDRGEYRIGGRRRGKKLGQWVLPLHERITVEAHRTFPLRGPAFQETQVIGWLDRAVSRVRAEAIQSTRESHVGSKRANEPACQNGDAEAGVDRDAAEHRGNASAVEPGAKRSSQAAGRSGIRRAADRSGVGRVRGSDA